MQTTYNDLNLTFYLSYEIVCHMTGSRSIPRLYGYRRNSNSCQVLYTNYGLAKQLRVQNLTQKGPHF